jgi:CDP-6-deoxy-D-xylo-4-hexulose-3-dehydrase
MRRTFWVGVYPGLTAEMLDYVAHSIREFVADPSVAA